MRKIICFSLIFVIMMCSSSAFAQLISWEIIRHSTDIDTLKREVTAYVNNGYVPLGITYDNVELYVLYVQDFDFGMQGWYIEWYKDRDAIQSGITARMNEGYIPTGITYTGDLVYVLYMMLDSSATAWQLIPSAPDLSAVERAIRPYVSQQGYVPVGVTFFEDEFWTLLLSIPGTTVQKYLIESYTAGSHAEAINANIEAGYIPWGIEYSGDSRIDILYVSF